MAAVVGNGSVVTSQNLLSTKNAKRYSDGLQKTLNGTLTHRKNGYLKLDCADNKRNGAGDADGKDSLPPPMDWSRYNIWRGSFEKCSLITAVLTHIGLYLLLWLGFLNQLIFKPNAATERNREGYAKLYVPFEQFFSRYIYRRVRHIFNRPIASKPGAVVTLKERVSDDHNWTFRFTGETREYINLGSYNYLGFTELPGPTVDAEAAARKYGLAMCSPIAELGFTPLHKKLEETMAAFLGVESAMVIGMGFATNALQLPGLLIEGTLVLSDAKNHASLIAGMRLSKAKVRVFRHNDMRDLERLARAAIVEKRWRKIVVVVEGVYSMEGSVVPLAALVALKRRLGLLLYVDEAHSIGAMGPRGRGVTDYHKVHPKDIDLLMGTFTKSFCAAGGYIAGPRATVDGVRALGHAHWYAGAMSPPVAQQILSAINLLASPVGQARVATLHANTRYFRDRLQALGVIVNGHMDSPVVPMIVYSFSKMAATVEELKKRGIATVGVGYPATPLNQSVIRFCVSAGHTREQLDRTLNAIEEVADLLGLRYSRRHPTPNSSIITNDD